MAHKSVIEIGLKLPRSGFVHQRRIRTCDTKKLSLVRNAKLLDWISKCTTICNDWCRHET